MRRALTAALELMDKKCQHPERPQGAATVAFNKNVFLQITQQANIQKCGHRPAGPAGPSVIQVDLFW